MDIKQADLRFPENLDDCFYWDDGDFHILLKDGGEIVLPNSYISSLSYSFGEPPTEDVVIVRNSKIW